MSNKIDVARVKQYSANIFHLSQQKGSRLAPFVRQESLRGKEGYFERLGNVTAVKKTTRHGDTPQIDTPHSRRRVAMVDYEYADLIDDEDRIRTLIDPESPYVQAAVWALGRAKDDEIISGALGNAFAGEDGGTSVSLPDSQKVAAHDTSTTTGNNLNVRTLRAVKKKFDGNDVDESIPRYIAVTSSQIESMLAETEVTSADFNTVRALAMGEIDSYMGFKFIRTERLGIPSANVTYNINDGTVGSGTGTVTAANGRRCIAWAQDGVMLAMGMDVRARVSERDDKSYATQVYAAMSMGATRLEEEKVVEVICSE